MANILNSLSKVSRGDVVLSVRDIKKTFMEGGQPLHILRGGGFDLHRGEIVALVGPSGSGKSTLLQCVGLLDKPTGGSILLAGVPVQKMDDEMRTMTRRRKIGFVYQRHNLLSDFTALENVVLPMLANGVDERSANVRAMKLLRAASVAHRASHLPGEMSGGEQQRTAVARALANNPEILLADEPTGSLDPNHAAAVFDLLLDLVRKQKMAMLFVTHDMNLAARADRKITICDGIVQ
ncbi:MAG TPA: ABC transporter ATP-binding protein [Candidatus Enterousia intestinigallinarum]|uniref:ABC transporter ATP-binding protein n=1 Tax=Candidatus Enterousia intestinigallinarum TaxID=2840790 RepID=A0A9D1JW82_9PROT|nr:ABC transporter ATP-binding protein [Candidatus Enterousia intestinigallinarum]